MIISTDICTISTFGDNMDNATYKFERYRDTSFPVYLSIQKNRPRLVNPHFHDDMELLTVLEGSVSVLIGTDEYICKKGDKIFIAPTIMHEVNSLCENSAVLGLVFRLSAFEKYFETENIPYATENCKVFRHGEPFTKALNEETVRALKIYNKNESTYKIKMTACILNIIATLLSSNGLSQGDNSPKSSQLRPAMEYIENHYNEKIKISTLSSLVGVCDDRFIRVFKEQTGRTPVAYIMQFRLHEAMKLLSSGEYTVSEAAEKTGFSDIRYFSRVFKKNLGQTPSAYCKSFRE